MNKVSVRRVSRC